MDKAMKGEIELDNKNKEFDKFKHRLAASKEAVMIACNYYHEKGWTVQLNPTNVAPSPDQWENYVDNGDIHISARIEVKGSSEEFTSIGDVKYKTPLIMNKNAWDRANPKPAGVLILNKSRTYAKYIGKDTFEHWFEKEINDPYYENGTYLAYAAPIELWKFIKI